MNAEKTREDKNRKIMAIEHDRKYPFKHGKITEQILGGFYNVYNSFGYGFLEKVYENALKIELANRNLKIELQKAINGQPKQKIS